MKGAVAALVAVVALAGCGLNVTETPPPSGPLPTNQASLMPAFARLRASLDDALRSEAAVSLDDAPEGYRPAQPPAFVYAPRAVVKVRLPNDPNRLYVVFYAFADPASASTAGHEAARFYAGGPALVQFPADTQFVLGQLGDLLIFSAWSPASTSDRVAAQAAFDVIRDFAPAIPIVP